MAGAEPVKKRNVRGPTYMPKVVRRMQGRCSTIRYKKRGQLIGKNASEMQSYIGVVAHQTVPLSICSWPKVSAELKNKIWEQVRATYDVDPKCEKVVLSSAGLKWRQFESNLVVEIIIPNKEHMEKLRRPPLAYNFINQKDWETFVALRLSAKYLKMHAVAIERVKRKKYHYRLSRLGYANKEAKVQEQFGLTSDIERHELWKMGHKKKNREYSSESVREVVEKIDEILKKYKEGFVTFYGANDVLTAVIGPEHSGSVRALGKVMSYKTTQTQDRTQIHIPVSEKFNYSAQNYGKNFEAVKKEEIDNLKVIFL
ncbi:hypothetical protein UlMin_033072 [Ulmus minor]